MNVRFVLVFIAFFAVACGSDTEPTGASQCETGQRWNPILTVCETITPFNNTANNQNNGNNENNANNDNNVNNENNENNVTTDMGEEDVFVDECLDGFGSLIGKACAPSGEPLAAADVVIEGVDCDGNAFTLMARTGTDGLYTFDMVPHGTHMLKVTTGSFNTEAPVRVVADMQTDLVTGAEKVCLDQNVEIAVIEGLYDHVEGLLDNLNLTYTMVADDQINGSAGATFLSDLNAMMAYDIVFLNCGNYFLGGFFPTPYETQQAAIGATLRQYVESGKSLYVSDWAHPFIEAAFPEMIDWLGGETDLRAIRDGYAPQSITATVGSPELENVLGANTAEIEFPHDPDNDVINILWAMAEGVGPDSVTHLSGDAIRCGGTMCSAGDTQTGTPLLVTYQHPSGGTVVFTSFHNERQSTLNDDMERIMRFLIFSL